MAQIDLDQDRQFFSSFINTQTVKTTREIK
jgi:hypothetical protein